MSTLSEADQTVVDTAKDPNIDMCLKLNAEKSIVDSGTTNIRLPDNLFRQVKKYLFIKRFVTPPSIEGDS